MNELFKEICCILPMDEYDPYYVTNEDVEEIINMCMDAAMQAVDDVGVVVKDYPREVYMEAIKSLKVKYE